MNDETNNDADINTSVSTDDAASDNNITTRWHKGMLVRTPRAAPQCRSQSKRLKRSLASTRTWQSRRSPR
jgi:hypothetical protein